MRRIWRNILTGAVAMAFTLMSAAAPASAHTVYRVRRGDSLWKISRRFGTTVTALRQANGEWDNLIYPGQRLVIPSGRDTAGSGQAKGRVQLSPRDRDLLARVVTAEAGGEPYKGQVAVAAVILNRVKSPLFPDTVRGVVMQGRGRQFESVLIGTAFGKPTATAYRAVRDAERGWDPTGGALFFFNPAKTKNKFLWGRPHAVTIGRHRFTF